MPIKFHEIYFMEFNWHAKLVAINTREIWWWISCFVFQYDENSIELHFMAEYHQNILQNSQ